MKCLRSFVIFAVMIATVQYCIGADLSFTGTFTSDSDVQLFTFTLLNPTPNVSFRTWSYAGGVNNNGQTIQAGGFDVVLDLFLSDGTMLNPGISGPCSSPLSGNPLTDLLPDPVTGACGDVYYPTTLTFPGGVWDPGTYTLALAQDANAAVGPTLADGFFASAVLGLPAGSNFTCQVGAPGFQGNPPVVPVTDPFCDEFSPGIERTGAWAIDFNNVDSAAQLSAVPEPASLPLALLGSIIFIGVVRSRFKQ